MIDALKSLFQDSTAIKEQYREGMMGRTGGYNFYENTLLQKFTSGSDANGYTVNGAAQTGALITVQVGGGIFTLSGPDNEGALLDGAPVSADDAFAALDAAFEFAPETWTTTQRAMVVFATVGVLSRSRPRISWILPIATVALPSSVRILPIIRTGQMNMFTTDRKKKKLPTLRLPLASHTPPVKTTRAI